MGYNKFSPPIGKKELMNIHKTETKKTRKVSKSFKKYHCTVIPSNSNRDKDQCWILKRDYVETFKKKKIKERRKGFYPILLNLSTNKVSDTRSYKCSKAMSC